MQKQLGVEFANFICKFGEKNLLDLAEEVIIPAFLTPNLTRTYGDTRYLFYNPKMVVINENKKTTPILCLAGRFIKDTILERDQVFEENKLVRDHQRMRSAPSSFFVLILNNHKLIYVNETSGAPNLQAFNATISSFAKRKHFEFINKLYKKRKKEDVYAEARVTKKALVKLYAYPDIKIIPLSSQSSLEQFINKYAVLKKVQARLVETNHELESNQLFAALRSKKEEIGSSATTLTHYNQKGLSKEKAILQLVPIANQGNTEIKLDGKDSHGDTLRGNNESFKIRVPIATINQDVEVATQDLLATYERLKIDGTMQISEAAQKSNDNDKIEAILNRIGEENG